jgi:hypothetical protein
VATLIGAFGMADGVHGIAHEHEGTRVVVLEFAEMRARLMHAAIQNGFTLVALWWLVANRDAIAKPGAYTVGMGRLCESDESGWLRRGQPVHLTAVSEDCATSDPLYAVLIPLLAEQLGVSRDVLRPDTRLYHDLNVTGEDWEALLQLLGKTFGVNLTALNGEIHWPTKRSFWSIMAYPVGRDYFPITVSDIAEWIKASEFRYDYNARRAIPDRDET